MNYAIAGVNAGQITRHKLLEDHLPNQQQANKPCKYLHAGRINYQDHALQDWLRTADFRSIPVNGHSHDRRACLKSAIAGHEPDARVTSALIAQVPR